MDAANEIRQARLQLGLTQQQLADLLGVTTTSVSGWERGTKTPTYQHVKRIRALAAGDGPVDAEAGLRERVERLASLVEELTLRVLELDSELKRARGAG